jgi:hypothetical protein
VKGGPVGKDIAAPDGSTFTVFGKKARNRFSYIEGALDRKQLEQSDSKPDPAPFSSSRERGCLGSHPTDRLQIKGKVPENVPPQLLSVNSTQPLRGARLN